MQHALSPISYTRPLLWLGYGSINFSQNLRGHNALAASGSFAPGGGAKALRQRRANELTTNNKLRERTRFNFARAMRSDKIVFADKASLAGAGKHSPGSNPNPPQGV
jgi:hypothetical protein